jgi:hypothetical protein
MSMLRVMLLLGVAMVASSTNIARAVPPGWNPAGCDNSYRSLWTLTTTSQAMTVELCLNACHAAGSTVGGVVYTFVPFDPLKIGGS